jgi:hypothetical protein
LWRLASDLLAVVAAPSGAAELLCDLARPEEIASQSPIARAWRAFEHALDDKIKQAAIAA